MASSFVIQSNARACGVVSSSNSAGSEMVDINSRISDARSSGDKLQGNVGLAVGSSVGLNVVGDGVGTSPTEGMGVSGMGAGVGDSVSGTGLGAGVIGIGAGVIGTGAGVIWTGAGVIGTGAGVSGGSDVGLGVRLGVGGVGGG